MSLEESSTPRQPTASVDAVSDRSVFVTGGTGYIGRRLIERLAGRGWRIHALARSGSQHRLPPECTPVVGDALNQRTFAEAVPRGATFVHLVGVAHPGPAKAAQFRTVDLASARAAVAAAVERSARHIVYVSVANPAPVMQAYIAARLEAEQSIRASGLAATILRPWYVLGPGHWWPVLLLPGYAVCSLVPVTRQGAKRLGLVTIAQMVRALDWAVETGPNGVRVLGVPEIRTVPS